MRDYDLFEFLCTECKGYVQVPLRIDDERDIIMVCPKCQHEHYRGLKDGEITERRHSARQDTEYVHRIEPTMAAYSREPKLQKLAARGPLGDLWARFAKN